MAILRQIAQLGQPVLREPTNNIEDFQDPAIQGLIDDMIVTVDDAGGVGLAAPQVFQSLSLFIVASRPNLRYPQAPRGEPTAMINPELLWGSDEKESGWEGCLSIPGIRGMVPRHKRIGVRYLNRHGELREIDMEGFLARIFQHEFDHIHGVVFLDRIEDNKDIVTEKEYLRLAS